MGKEAVILENDKTDGIPLPLNPQRIEKHLDGIEAVLLTYPDYYGNFCEMEQIKRLCNERNIPLLIDGAHGAAYKGSTLHASNFADMWVDGVHKTLPCLTQGAVVSANKQYAEALAEGVDIFRTTSPNYLLMASVEYAVKTLPNFKIQEKIDNFKRATEAYENWDWTKAVYTFGENAFKVKAFFEKHNVYPEFCDGDNIMFYFSSETTTKELRILKRLLRRARRKFPYVPKLTPETVKSATHLEIEDIPLSESIGRICAVGCGLFPPCTPMIASGERITADAVERMLQAENIFGLVIHNIDGENVRFIRVFKD